MSRAGYVNTGDSCYPLHTTTTGLSPLAPAMGIDHFTAPAGETRAAHITYVVLIFKILMKQNFLALITNCKPYWKQGLSLLKKQVQVCTGVAQL